MKTATKRKTRLWRNAEKKVGLMLRRLPADEYVVLEDVRAQYGNIDHLVIGRGRVFMLETKSHRGRVTWDGTRLLINGRAFRRNPICQINRNIRWLKETARRLFDANIWIVAVLVFPNADVAVRRPVKRVNVVSGKGLRELMGSFGP